MLANQRRQSILDLLREDGQAKVSNLCRIFKVSEPTIRQDLAKLEEDGLITREHGGAYIKDIGSYAKDLILHNVTNMEAKIRIAQKAITFIQNGDTIILDSGSTTTEIAKLLVNFSTLTVITNALNIALTLGTNPGINLIVTGGEFKAPTISLTGQKAADFFNGIHVDKLFLATAGISLKAGLTYPSISDLCVKRAMMDSADKVFLVADSTKLGHNSFASLGTLSQIDCLITDEGIPVEFAEMLKLNEIDFIIAD